MNSNLNTAATQACPARLDLRPTSQRKGAKKSKKGRKERRERERATRSQLERTPILRWSRFSGDLCVLCVCAEMSDVEIRALSPTARIPNQSAALPDAAAGSRSRRVCRARTRSETLPSLRARDRRARPRRDAAAERGSRAPDQRRR